MTNYDIGITTNVGEIQGGTGVNVVPGECIIGVDLRMPALELAEE
jgi:acetylornithine deacetylase/succinyl-diaminopimelate desuccinylase-like protein